MKKSFILTLTALAALMAVSCQKEEMGRTLTATIEQYEHNSKAYINNDYYACWEDGDKVSINGTTYPIDIENTTATIDAPTTGDLMAFYPASRVTALTATGGTVTLQHTQTYNVNADGYQIIDNPMAAYCPDGSTELRFRNLCALLKVTIVGNTSVKAIQVKGIDNQLLWGEAQLTLNEQGRPVLEKFTKGSNSVTLKFTDAEPINGSKSFYIVVPAKSDFDSLTIAVLTTNGTVTPHSKTSYLGESLSRNQIGAISYTPNGNEDATFTPDWTIRYTGTIVEDNISGDFGSTYLSNNSSDGYLLFDGPVTQIPYTTLSADRIFTNCTSITLPASITTIASSTFDGCSSLTSIDLSNTEVTVIRNHAFYGCSGLTSIDLPASLTTIELSAFRGCSSLTSISLPAGVTTIELQAFYGCSSLTSISLPAGVATIGTQAFYGCSSLTSISLPAGVTTIELLAFYGCSSLTSISLPAGVTTIGDKAFRYCSSLTSISLPAGVTTIGEHAFSDCSSLARVDCHRTTPPTLDFGAFDYISDTAKLHVPSNAGDYSSWESYFGGGIEKDL